MSHEEAARQLRENLSKHGRTPEKVAAAVVEAVEKNRGVAVHFTEARLGDIVHRLSRKVSGFTAAHAVAMGAKGMGKDLGSREDEAWFTAELDLGEAAKEEAALRH